MSRPLVECADDRYFCEPVEVSEQDYVRDRSGCVLTIMLKKKPAKRFLRVNAPVDCFVGMQGVVNNCFMPNHVLLRKKDVNGMHEFMDFGDLK